MSEIDPHASTDPYGTLATAREFVVEMAGAVQAHARVVQVYAEAGYEPGLMLAARSCAAYLRAMDAGLAEVERSRALIRLRRSTEAVGPGAGV